MSLTPQAYRKALGSFASGVTVVTTLYKGEKAGVTISSLSSVSLEPPLILFCLDRTSSLLPAFRRGTFFNVHILGEVQKHLAQIFASKTARNWHAAPHSVDGHGIPVLEGALSHLSCRVKSRTKAGDHDIILGSVLAAETTEEKPLLYFRRHYHLLGKTQD